MERQQLFSIAEQYKPSKQTLRRLRQVNLLLLVGPTGVGKSTLIKASGFPSVLGEASRKPRISERNGVDYWFRSEEEMLTEIRSGQYLQVAIGSEGDIKATHAGSFPEAGNAIFAVVASAVPTFRALPFAKTVTAVIVPPDYESWMQRVGQHHTSPEKLVPRLEEAKRSYQFALDDDQAKFVLNDNIDAAVRRLHQVMAGEEPDDGDRARGIAEDLLQRIG